jgi:hypothetical protein
MDLSRIKVMGDGDRLIWLDLERLAHGIEAGVTQLNVV